MRKTAITLATVAAFGAAAVAVPAPARSARFGARAGLRLAAGVIGAGLAASTYPGYAYGPGYGYYGPRYGYYWPRYDARPITAAPTPTTADRATTATAIGASTGKGIMNGRETCPPGHFSRRSARRRFAIPRRDMKIGEQPMRRRLQSIAVARATHGGICFLAAILSRHRPRRRSVRQQTTDARRRIQQGHRGTRGQRRRRPVRGQLQDTRRRPTLRRGIGQVKKGTTQSRFFTGCRMAAPATAFASTCRGGCMSPTSSCTPFTCSRRAPPTRGRIFRRSRSATPCPARLHPAQRYCDRARRHDLRQRPRFRRGERPDLANYQGRE